MVEIFSNIFINQIMVLVTFDGILIGENCSSFLGRYYSIDFRVPKSIKFKLVSFSVTIGVASCIISHLRNRNGCVAITGPEGSSVLVAKAGDAEVRS